MYYICLLKNKCVEYKRQIIFCLLAIFAGILIGIIANCNNKEVEIVMIKSNVFLYYLKFSLLFLFVYFLIFISVFNRYLNILTPIAIIMLGYYFGKYLDITFIFNLKYAFLSLLLFFNFIFLISIIFITLLVICLKDDYFSCNTNCYLIKNHFFSAFILYLIFLFLTFLIFFIFSGFTNTIIIV